MQYIDKQKDFDDLCKNILNKKEFAFDTEFIRENTFFPILALMQIKLDKEIYIIDPTPVPYTHLTLPTSPKV